MHNLHYSLPFNLFLMSSVFTWSQRLLRVCVLLYLDLNYDFRFIIVKQIAMQDLNYTNCIHIKSLRGKIDSECIPCFGKQFNNTSGFC